jgi:hypothetical protein
MYILFSYWQMKSHLLFMDKLSINHYYYCYDDDDDDDNVMIFVRKILLERKIL